MSFIFPGAFEYQLTDSPQVGPIGITHAGWKFYLLFCIGNVLQVFFIYFFVKETKGLTLEEIDLLYAKASHKAELEQKLRYQEHVKGDEGVVTGGNPSGELEKHVHEQVEFPAHT